MEPKLIVFDFHGVLSLKEGSFKDFKELLDYKTIKINNIKTYLKKFKTNDSLDWYLLLKKSKINTIFLMPTLDEVILFIENITLLFPKIQFGIASMGEIESFMIAILKYCFEERGKVSPFNESNVVGFQTLNKYSKIIEKGKLTHISVILKNLNLNIPLENIVLIDDHPEVIINTGICGILVEDFFKISDWNRGCYSK
jgi:hypothetical protein